ncbi:hypothetical protein Kpho02_05180 [Kitasatospora phosalacinea]|uniref:Uncharacterized protein n=1 Tax=Kitasatospora phosalacinea TaxID=2065 RepID=A0A9W6Q1H0_9ACTN|nr:hypothetical protein Kpho02_05180 [Kitasatospora phosalacinea]
MVVVAGEAPVEHEGAVDLLDHPPLRLRDEALARVVGVAPDHLDGDVLHRPVDDHRVLEALVDQDLLQTHPAPHRRLVQQGDAGLVVVRARGQDHHADDQAQHVDGQSPLPAGRLLVRVQPRGLLRHPGRRTDGLGVDDHQGRVL